MSRASLRALPLRAKGWHIFLGPTWMCALRQGRDTTCYQILSRLQKLKETPPPPTLRKSSNWSCAEFIKQWLLHDPSVLCCRGNLHEWFILNRLIDGSKQKESIIGRTTWSEQLLHCALKRVRETAIKWIVQTPSCYKVCISWEGICISDFMKAPAFEMDRGCPSWLFGWCSWQWQHCAPVGLCTADVLHYCLSSEQD